MKRINIQNTQKHPLIAALIGVLWVFCCSSCIQEQLLSPQDAPTTLRIQTKGITIEAPTEGTDNYTEQLEEYVKTLRIFFFNGENDTQPYMWYSEDLSAETELSTENGEIIITLEDQLPDGNYTVYAVANEQTGMFTNTNIDTNDGNVSMTISTLNGINVTMPNSPITFSADAPIPMSCITEIAVLGGENINNNMTIELVRTVGKVELLSVTDGENTLTNYTYALSAEGNVYTTYPLFGEDSGTDNGSLSNATTDSKPLYLSISESTIKITVSVTIDGKSYTGELTTTDKITRNQCIQIKAKILKQENCLLLKPTIVGWTLVDLTPEYE